MIGAHCDIFTIFTIPAISLYLDSQETRYFGGNRSQEKERCWGGAEVWESILNFFLGPPMLASNICSWHLTLTWIPTPWQSSRKCKKPQGLRAERKNLLLLSRDVRNCIVRVCCSLLESTSGLLFCLLYRHSIQMSLWPGTIVTVPLQVLWASRDTAKQPCTREALCIYPLI